MPSPRNATERAGTDGNEMKRGVQLRVQAQVTIRRVTAGWPRRASTAPAGTGGALRCGPVQPNSQYRDIAKSESRAEGPARPGPASERMDRKVVLLKSVAHPIRLGVLTVLARGPARVG